MDWQIFFAALSAGLVAAAVGILALWFSHSQVVGFEKSIFTDETRAAIFLFDGESLIDSTPEARGLLAASQAPGTEWEKLMAFLAPRFDGLEAQLLRLPELGSFDLASRCASPALTLRAEHRGGLSQLELRDAASGATQGSDPLIQRAVL